jgi:hypothetical protein
MVAIVLLLLFLAHTPSLISNLQFFSGKAKNGQNVAEKLGGSTLEGSLGPHGVEGVCCVVGKIMKSIYIVILILCDMWLIFEEHTNRSIYTS